MLLHNSQFALPNDIDYDHKTQLNTEQLKWKILPINNDS